MSQSLAVLERKGLLTKEPDAAHGKRVHLRLTPAGATVLDDSWAERLEQALGGLPEEAQALEATLRRLLSACKASTASAPSAFAGTAATSCLSRTARAAA